MTKIEELKHRCVVEITMNGETDPINAMAKITLAAIEDAQRYKKIDGKWFYKLGSGAWADVQYKKSPPPSALCWKLRGWGMSDLTPPWQLPDNHKFNKVLDLVLTREAKYLDIIEKQNKEIKELRGILTGGIECGYVKPERRP